MKLLKNWKNLTFALALFLAGVLTGGLNTLGLTKHLQREQMSIENLHDSLLLLLETELRLTPDQMETIRPILGEACEEYRAETIRAMNRVDEIVGRTNQRIARELNSEQKGQLESLEQLRQESRKDLKSRFFND